MKLEQNGMCFLTVVFLLKLQLSPKVLLFIFKGSNSVEEIATNISVPLILPHSKIQGRKVSE